MDILLAKIGATSFVIMLPIFWLHTTIDNKIGYYLLKAVCAFCISMLLASTVITIFSAVMITMWG